MSDFCFFDNWFDIKYQDKSSSRYVTFKIALNLLNQNNGKLVVETGTIRFADDWGAGMSTQLFADYCQTYGGKVVTVDIREDNISTCRKVTQDLSHVITYVCADSAFYLAEYNGPKIDLLYLDSYDFPVNGKVEDREEGVDKPQAHNLLEFKLAEKHLASNAVLLLDDNNLPFGGKPKLTKEYLRTKPEWKCLYESQQSAWMRCG